MAQIITQKKILTGLLPSGGSLATTLVSGIPTSKIVAFSSYATAASGVKFLPSHQADSGDVGYTYYIYEFNGSFIVETTATASALLYNMPITILIEYTE